MAFSRVFRRVNLLARAQIIILFCALIVGCEFAERSDSEGDPAGRSQDHAKNVDPGDGISPAFVSADERIRAVTLDARRAPPDSTLLAIRDLGVTHVALISFGFQDRADDSHIRFSPDVRWYSESEAGIRELADRLKELDVRIILKPQIWIRGGAWTADIGFSTEDDWQSWTSNYSVYVMYMARLAEDIEADLLVIGTELGNAVRERPVFWRRLIAEIRQVYSGKLTYGANWHNDYEQVSFWDALDYIGVQAYFPLTDAPNPSVPDLLAGWRRPIAALDALSEREQRPVVFTEIGYRSVPYAAAEPWRWPSRDEAIPPDTALQANLYRAFFEEVWHQPWFAGAIVWKFYPEGRRRSVELDFTPQGKPAERVIRDGFSR